MQSITFCLVVVVTSVICLQQSESIRLTRRDPAIRYSRDYLYGLPSLNYYLEQMAEDNGAQGHDENVAFARESRANPGDFKEQLFNTWMKKGRGSIRLTKK